MPSPFPGMDPYLEEPSIWSDLHLTLIVAMRAELNAHLPKGYLAAADRHVWIEDAETDLRERVRPDVHVIETSPTSAIATRESASAVMPRSVTLPLRERKGKPFLKIVDAQDRRVVTAVELLSPANKARGDDSKAYLAKREDYPAAGVNLVEINLLRAGTPPPLGKPNTPKGTYYILVCRANEMPRAERWIFTVRDPLPSVPISLRAGESIALNLRACLDRAYDEARYDEELDYTLPPMPNLDDAHARWAKRRLAARRT